LQSDATLPFEVQTNEVTHLSYQFLAGDEIVTFDTGMLEISIAVEESASAAPLA
jgi:hypothetical protein